MQVDKQMSKHGHGELGHFTCSEGFWCGSKLSKTQMLVFELKLNTLQKGFQTLALAWIEIFGNDA